MFNTVSDSFGLFSKQHGSTAQLSPIKPISTVHQDTVLFRGQASEALPDFRETLAEMGFSARQGETPQDFQSAFDFIVKVNGQDTINGSEYISPYKAEILDDMKISNPAQGGLLYFVEDKNKQVIGLITHHRYDKRHNKAMGKDPDPNVTVELGDMYVDRAFWGQKIAKTLILGTEPELRRMGYRTILLKTNTRHVRAHEFYKKAGYQQQGPIYTEADGQSYRFMTKAL